MRTGLYQVYWRDISSAADNKWIFECAFVFQEDAELWARTEINNDGTDYLEYKIMYKGRNIKIYD